MIYLFRFALSVVCALLFVVTAAAQDDIGFGNGLFNFSTSNFDVSLIRDSGTLASLSPSGSDFDFLPFDYFWKDRRVQNGSYHWGDLTVRYRKHCGGNWTNGDSAAARTPVEWLETDLIASMSLNNTMKAGSLSISREWADIDGDLALYFTISNPTESSIEIGSLGFAAAVNNIFTDRRAEDMYEKCSFMDPYIGLDAGYLQVTPISGVGPAMVVTPLGDTPLEAYRFLPEEDRGGTRIESNGWEGYYEWMVHTSAWARNEWKGAEPWNPPSAIVLRNGEEKRYGLRFTVVKAGVKKIAEALEELEIPQAIGVPGYIVPRDTPARLLLKSSSPVGSVDIEPEGALVLKEGDGKAYTVTPFGSAWGRARVQITYEDERVQTIHYYITKSATEAISDLGNFILTEQWYDDETDPFGRSPSPMGYDYETKSIVDQDSRVWVAGLSDEGGASAYTVAAIKQAFQPNEEEIAKLEEFIDKVLFKTVQDEEYAVIRSAFFYEPELVPNYNYSSGFEWENTFSRNTAYEVDRAYNYVWPAASYWALYRAGRAYDGLLKVQDREWYLDHAFKTVMRGMQPDIGFNDAGLMGETVFGEILTDLEREGWDDKAEELRNAMKARVDEWLTQEYPFGSEMSWDSTGQEGVYYWSRLFGEDDMSTKARDSILGYMPTIPHWGYNGNARRYWDFVVTGKTQNVERQIHHYGSALNALPLLSSFHDTADPYLLRVGYAGTMAPLSNIYQDGFASCAMHARPEHLSWDGYSGDYGPGFVGMALGSGAYLVEDDDLGLAVYGGNLEVDGDVAKVDIRDAVRQKILVGPLGLEVKIDAVVIQGFEYNLKSSRLRLQLGQRGDGIIAKKVIIWTSGGKAESEGRLKVMTGGKEAGGERGGRQVSLNEDSVTEVDISLQSP